MRTLLPLLLISLGIAATHAAESPSQAALAFAEGLRDGLATDKLLERCALNPDTGERKKDQITTQWKADGKKMLPLAFRVAEEKITERHAAVVLAQYDEAGGSSSHVISLAIVKRAQEWLAAPVMSSFQNSVVSYDPEILTERKDLEHWMLAREIFLREDIKNRASQSLRDAMQKSIDAESLKTISPESLVQGLITAIRTRDQAGVLARLGGFSSDEIPEWDNIVRRVTKAFSSSDLQKWPWKLMAQPQALIGMGPTLDLGDEKSLDMLILHPDSLSEEPDYLSFSIQYDEAGRARVLLPEVFLMGDVSEDEMGQIMDYEDEEHLAMYQSIYLQARKGLEGTDLKSAGALAQLLEKSLQNNDFGTFWSTGAAPAKKSLLLNMPGLVTLWQKVQGSAIGSSLFGRVGFREHKEHALLVLQSYAPRNTDAIQLQKLWLVRRDGQWALAADAPEETPEELDQWWDDNKKAWGTKLADSLVVDAVRIGGLAATQPDAAKVREVFQAWLQAVQERSLKKVIPFCAAFQDDRSIQAMMRALAGELMYGSGRYEVLEVHVHGRWAAVSTKYRSDQAKSTVQYPLYVFVATDHGPRMLSQVELKLSQTGNRSRNYLNNLAFTELKKYLPDAAVDELKTIYDKHTTLVNEQSVIKP